MFSTDAFKKYPCVNGNNCTVPLCVFGHDRTDQPHDSNNSINSNKEDGNDECNDVNDEMTQYTSKLMTGSYNTILDEVKQQENISVSNNNNNNNNIVEDSKKHGRLDANDVSELNDDSSSKKIKLDHIHENKKNIDITNNDKDNKTNENKSVNPHLNGLSGRQVAKLKRKQQMLNDKTIVESTKNTNDGLKVPNSNTSILDSSTAQKPLSRLNATNKALEGASAYDLTKPPQVKPSFKVSHPWKPRQNAIGKIFQQYQRIYKNITDKTIRFQLSVYHSYLQEEWACENSQKHNYTSKIMNILSHLKNRKKALSSIDAGIYPFYKEPDLSEPLKITDEDLNYLITPHSSLSILDYPMFPIADEKDNEEQELNAENSRIINNDNEIEDTENNIELRKSLLEKISNNELIKLDPVICERCQTKFIPHYPLTDDDKTKCIYHYGRYSRKHENWFCCNTDLTNQGCEKSAHVSKDLSPLFEKAYPFEWLIDENKDSYQNYESQLQPELKSLLEEKRNEIPNPPLLVLDCEMGYSVEGLSLLRVTFVKQNNELFFDSLVIPDMPIIDYNSRFSGLSTVEGGIPFSQIRIFLKLLFKDTPNLILAGHGLENDLKALRFGHKNVVDTVHLYPHHNGLPFKFSLRHLVKYYLGKDIQSGFGHDSKEDCLATGEIIKLFVEEKRKKLENK